MIAWLEEHGARRGRDHLPAARLAVQPAALLGRAVPDRLRRDRPAGRAARVDAAGRAARGRRLLAADLRRRRRRHRRRSRRCRGRRTGSTVELDLGDGPKTLPPRDQHDAALGRLVLVRAALPGPAQRQGVRRPGERAVLDGPAVARRPRRRRPVRRRRRARRAAPAVRPVLAQGAVRPGPRLVVEPFRRLFNQGYIQAYAYTDDRGFYVPAAEVVERDGRFFLGDAGGPPRVRQDGQEPEERRHPGRDVRRVRRRHLPGVRDVDGPAGRVPPVGDPGRRRLAAVPAAGLARGRRRGDRRGPGHRRAAGRRRPAGCCTGPSTASATTWTSCGSTPPSPS